MTGQHLVTVPVLIHSKCMWCHQLPECAVGEMKTQSVSHELVQYMCVLELQSVSF